MRREKKKKGIIIIIIIKNNIYTNLIVFFRGIVKTGVVHGPLGLIGKNCERGRRSNLTPVSALSYNQWRGIQRRYTIERDWAEEPMISPEYASCTNWNCRLASPATAGSRVHRSGCHFLIARQKREEQFRFHKFALQSNKTERGKNKERERNSSKFHSKTEPRKSQTE